LVVIFQENVSFDHYFGTYPHVVNIDGQPFTALPGTPTVDGLTPELLTNNPNKGSPMRLGGPAQQVTCSQDHEYTAEQKAFHGGAMDQFIENTEVSDCKPPVFKVPGMVMAYYDGNSVTALWNFAQHYAMSDNSYDTTFGPSTPGHLNLVSGQTHGVTKEFMPGGQPFPTGDVVENAGNGQGTVVGDAQPLGDDCSNRDQVQLSADNKNIGDLLNAKGVTWGYFEGGFKPTSTKPDGTAVCGASHNVGTILGGTGKSGPMPLGTKDDYIPHHEPFQYYPSTATPTTCRPARSTRSAKPTRPTTNTTSRTLGRGRRGPPASGQFPEGGGLSGWAPRVLRSARRAQFLVETINHLQKLPEWKDMAIVVAYDDSDGWYDHKPSPTVSGSPSPADALTNPGVCGANGTAARYQVGAVMGLGCRY
jgi:phospholipase C